MKRKKSHLCWEYSGRSGFPHLLKQLHWISAEGLAMLCYLASLWLVCRASQLNSGILMTALMHLSAHGGSSHFHHREMENCCSSAPAGTCSSPVNLMNILTGVAQNLSSPFLQVSFSFIKQERLARFRAGCNSIHLSLINAQ